jgi:mannose-6-phosphate isomerase-like protein (cupin superfamily)
MKHLSDSGPNPFIFNTSELTKSNGAYRQTPWTGQHLQITLMNILPGDDIGMEIHEDTDQFICVVAGIGHARLGTSKDEVTLMQGVSAGWAVVVPAGTWHDITNTGTENLKVYTIYAPIKHPHNTIHETKDEAKVDPAEA